MLSTIELFAGAGGLALGVEKAGFHTIGLVECNKDACDTLRKNRTEWNVICDDIEWHLFHTGDGGAIEACRQVDGAYTMHIAVQGVFYPR